MNQRTIWMIGIGAAVLLAVGAVVFGLSLPGMMERRVMQLRYEGEWTEALSLQERMVRLFPANDATRSAVLSSVTSLALGPEQLLIAGSGWISARGGTAPDDPERATAMVLSHLERIIARQRNPLWRHNIEEQTAKLLADLGRSEEAASMMEAAVAGFLAHDLEWRAVDARITTIEWMTDQRSRLTAALDLLQRRPPPFQEARLQVIAGDAFLAAGNYGPAREAYLRALLAEKANTDMAARSAADGARRVVAVLEEQPSHLKATFGLRVLDYLQAPDGDPAALSGIVTVGGSALGGVTVYLTPTEGDRRGSPPPSVELRSFAAVTGSDGAYSFAGLPPGRYIPSLRIEGGHIIDVGQRSFPDTLDLRPGEERELDFRFHPRISITNPAGSTTLPAEPAVSVPVDWEPLPAADRYAVELLVFTRDEEDRIGGWTTRTLATALPAPAYRIEIHGLDLLDGVALAYSPSLSPTAALGPWYPGNPVGIRIVGEDADGATVSDSEGYLFVRGRNYPLLEMADDYAARFGSAGPAARATAERRYDEAIDLWRAATEERDPQVRATALLVLARLLTWLPEGAGRDTVAASRLYADLLAMDGVELVLPPEIAREAASGVR